MSLTEKQIEKYRKKLGSRAYMEMAINGLVEKFAAGHAVAKLPCDEPATNNAEEKRIGGNDGNGSEKPRHSIRH
jgi:hypothetical protein